MTFEEFSKQLKRDCVLANHVCGSRLINHYRWMHGEQHLFDERTRCSRGWSIPFTQQTPAQKYHTLANEIVSSYWIGHYEPDAKPLAQSDAKKAKGAISEEFYGDGYFVITNDLDGAIALAWELLQRQNQQK